MRAADRTSGLLLSLRRLKTAPATAARWLARTGSLLPGPCALCAALGRHALCAGCRAQFFATPSTSAGRCRQCALPLPSEDHADEALCGHCLHRPPAFDATVAAANYAAPIEQLVLALKFGGRLALAPLLADLMRDALLRSAQRSLPLPTCLIAVPLGASRLQQRGFNQALEIARPLSAGLGIALATRTLQRTRDTAPQTLLSPVERRINLRDAFTLAPNMVASVRGAHVGLVDDVMTTGETLNAAAGVLKRFGAARVTNLVFARTLPH